MDTNSNSIAIIGMTGRFPGAANVDEFWSNLVAGVESISFFSDEELAASGLDVAQLRKNPDFVAARGILKEPDLFDAAFFNFSAKEAEIIDPQQRLFLEASWEALENAGYDPARFQGYIGVFAGMGSATYFLNNLHSRPDVTGLVGDMAVALGNEKDFIASRIAYKLNLRGPAISTHTACSTSLVTVCQACHALLGYQCDIALAGGVSVSFPQKRATYHQEGGIFSPDGHCRPFDAQAGGTCFSDGLGVVVLKRLAEALNDGDQIYAVIRGVALNNDGAAKIGYTAPSVRGQAEVVALALGHAGVEPGSISYVETHGTATPLGDPIEIAGLTQAFRAGTGRKNFCAIGSVKSNVGHLVAAAGVTSLIKTALALQHKQLPPSLHFSKPNPKIDFANSPFFVNSKLTDWQAGPTPRRAGVSSFGVGGTNAHVVLEESPALAPSGPSRASQLLLLSARSKSALDAATANLLRHFKANPDLNLADAAFTLQEGRQVFEHRQMLVCRDLADAATALGSRDPKRLVAGVGAVDHPPVAFMFPGQGAQHVNMGADLYRTEAVFKQEIDRCSEILLPFLGMDLRKALYPSAENAKAAEELLLQTRVTQPALFVVSYALARLWMAWGIKPRAMIGHSVGEYVAACLAGVFSLPDALRLVAERAKLVQAQPPGAMLAVRLPEAQVLPYLTQELSIAALNSPAMCVISGPIPAIERLEDDLTKKRVPTKRLPTSHAFHSAMMDPVVAPLTELLRTIKLNEPAIPYVSNVTGRWITNAEAKDPAYWASHVRQAVRFADGMSELAKQTGMILLEVGPGQSLSAFARQHPAWPPGHLVLSSFSPSKDQEQAAMLTALGRLWIAGASVHWSGFYQQEKRRRVTLPTYPFERKRYWVEPMKTPARPVAMEEATTPLSIEADQPASTEPVTTDQDGTLKSVAALFQEISGVSMAGISPSARFTELGLDSLLLAQASQMLQKKFGMHIAFRRLLNDLSTLDDLAAFLDQSLPPEPPAQPVAQAPASTDESLPMTESQKELWLAAQASNDASCAFNQIFGIRLRGKSTPEAIRSILQQLVDRHDALRAIFESDGSTQRILPSWKFELPIRDLTAFKESDQERELANAMRQEDQAAFDLARGPLFRARLFKLSGGQHVLALAAHHIILDGWSMAVLLREFSQLYEACEQGTTAILEPAMQFRQYVQWLNSPENRAATQTSEAYWLAQFANPPNDLELPADRPRPAVKTYRSGEREVLLDSSFYASLREAARAHDCTLFVLLLASLKAWLFRLTGENDLVVGIPAAGQLAAREHPGNTLLAGHCVNTLPVRSHCDGNASFSDHLRSVKSTMLNAYEHQSLTMGTLVRKLNLRTDPSRVPLVPLVFNLGRHSRQLRLPATDVVLPPKSFFFFDLGIEAHDSGKDLRVVFRYNTELFDDARIDQMLGQFQTLLKAATQQPSEKLAHLPLLTEAGRRQILVDWNQTQTPYPRNRCLHELFEEQAMRAPDAVAVLFEGRQLTYRELNCRANQLARYLRRKGVGPDALVGIGVERSIEMAVGLLGILKAGGAYVPLDPAYPTERLAFMLEDTRPVIVLTQESLRQKLPKTVSALCLDTDWKAISEEEDGNPGINVNADNLAYVMYTSGSTGRPKGIEIPHRGVVRLVKGANYIKFSPEEVFLQMAPLAFDASTFEIWGAWLHGARVVVMPPGQPTLQEIGHAIRIHQVTTVFITTSLFNALVEERVSDLKPLRQLLVGGEAVSVAHMRRAFQELTGCRLFNAYGPTESTTFACSHPIGPQTRWDRPTPIGRPIDNTQTFILDASLQPVPIGVPGELHIGGDGLARGYLRRPDLTSEKFIRNPFSADATSRLYKTGDLARFLPSGDIEFLGRRDYQVKIRGFRIELGEIESVLAALPGVGEAVVMAREDTPGEKRLVAYLTMKEEAAPKTSEWRGLLKAKLPDYMVPSAFLILERFPLSANGKVDRKALPKPEFEHAADQFAPPKTPTEIALAEIWSEVLGVKQVGLRDNFFELGGHSLMATRIVSRIRTVWNIELPLTSLFQNPTLAGLAAVIDQQCMDDIQPDELSRMLTEIEGANGNPAV